MQPFDLEIVAKIMRHTNWHVEYFMQQFCEQMVVFICAIFFTDLGFIQYSKLLHQLTMNSKKINSLVKHYDLPKFRIRQFNDAFFKQNIHSFELIKTLPKSLRTILNVNEQVLTVTPHKLFSSKSKKAYKALLRLHDDALIETVLLNPKPGLWSCCISSQVGCGLGCTFCATGSMGLIRNLTEEEITDQVLYWQMSDILKSLGAKLNNIVYMGMGEPFCNKKAVFASLNELMTPSTFNIGARHISVSTAGIAPVIKEFADAFPQVNLALSLHAPDNAGRQKLMPINKPYPLEKLKNALDYYLDKTNRKVFFEYILIDHQNDSISIAKQLASFIKSINKNHLIHINLILYNKTDKNYMESQKSISTQFKHYLLKHGVSTTIRKNLGRDINGACGQLALKDSSSSETEDDLQTLT